MDLNEIAKQYPCEELANCKLLEYFENKLDEMKKDILSIKDLLSKGEKIKIYAIIRKYENKEK